jgi:hypothetical protein
MYQAVVPWQGILNPAKAHTTVVRECKRRPPIFFESGGYDINEPLHLARVRIRRQNGIVSSSRSSTLFDSFCWYG